MKRLLQLLAMAMIAIPVLAQQLTPEEAMMRVKRMSGTAQAKATKSQTRKLVYTMKAAVNGMPSAPESSDNLFYIFSDDRSFVIAGADEKLPALIAYGNSSAFSADSIPDNLRYWLDDYKVKMSAALAKGVTLTSPTAMGTPVVKPLITAKWAQEKPFNNDCNDIGQSSATGCVATAMAQIMYYHKWPMQGTGSHSYSYDLDFGGDIGVKTITPSVDFSSHTYNWSNMQDAYGVYVDEESGDPLNASYKDDQAADVACLLHDCGVSVDMIYAGGSSSASSAKVPYALTTYFGYDCGMSYLQKVLFSDEEWAQMIRTELDARRPVLYSGQTLNNEGHAFICDGYDNAGYYHMNWGWQGMANGYYLIVGTDALNPDVSGTGGGTVGLGYTEGNDMIIGIQKAQTGSSYNYFMYCNQPFTVDRSNITANTLINLKGGFFNGSIVEVEFEVGMRFKHTAADYSADINFTSSTLKTNSGFSSYGRNPSALRYNGKYEVYPIYRVKGTTEWKVMLYNKSWAVPTTTFSGGEEPPVVNPPVPEKKYYNVSVTSSSAEKGTVTVEGVADGKAEEGSDITITAVPREGYEFVKWSDDSDVNPRTINVKDNITLTAQFSAKQYNIIYKVDGSDYKTVTVEYGSEVTPIAAPEKEGYTFSGWKGLPESTMPAHDVTVNGTFSVNSYTLTYIYNNETVKEIMLEYGSEIPAFNYVPENPNHTFVGWRTEGYTTMPAHNLTFIADFVDGIGTITALPQDVKIFDASGKRIMKLQKGLNILVYPDGKAIKVRR
ncbi:MAG: C10 family peptidase [Prevotella sp.]|nr:C10 family peptidase [Prevotella sp.]